MIKLNTTAFPISTSGGLVYGLNNLEFVSHLVV